MGLYEHPKPNWRSICPNWIWSYSNNETIAFITRISQGLEIQYLCEFYVKNSGKHVKTVVESNFYQAMDNCVKELES